MAIYGAKTPPILAVVDPVPCAVFLKISLEFTVKRQLCRTAKKPLHYLLATAENALPSEPKLGDLMPSNAILALPTEAECEI